ncbi:hypothetical protein ACQ3G7_03385 [Kosakonia oryzendophytica]|uniref:hypothetical protein n=1 Tax=Kosakonia oryzendophytica TaxID=1005665 RepID=UPI003D326EB2
MKNSEFVTEKMREFMQRGDMGAESFRELLAEMKRHPWYQSQLQRFEQLRQPESRANPFVGYLCADSNAEAIVESLRRYLAVDEEPKPVESEAYYERLVQHITALDIRVVKPGPEGIPPRPGEDPQGVVIAFATAPCIIVHPAATPEVRALRVLHMLCLIGLGLSGIYYDDDTGIGQEAALCHAVATGFLAQEKAGWGTTEEQERT